MVNAATDIQIDGHFYKEDSKFPDSIVKHLEINDPSLLSNYIEVNGRWVKIEDKRITGMVKEMKHSLTRLRKHFNIKDDPRKTVVEDKSHMLRARPKKEEVKEVKFTKEKLEEKAEKMGFSKFRNWANKKFRVTGRSEQGIIKDILSGKIEL